MNTFLVIGLATVVLSISPPRSLAQDGKPKAAPTGNVVTLSADASAQLAERVLAHPDLPQRAAGHRLAAIRVSAEESLDAGGTPSTVTTVVLFDHTALEARRVSVDSATNRVLLNDLLPGRPQRSDRERDEAASIVARDPALARLIGAGAVLDGGFIVDDPRGSRRRMIQMKLISGDRRTPLRTIVVDLTRGDIAAVATANGGR